MKITVLHGENVNESRKRLNVIRDAIRKRGWEVVVINSDNLVMEKLRGNSLFGNETLYILEGINNLPKEDISEIEGNLLIWEKKTISITVLNKLPQPINVEKFEIPKYIFTFLDSLYPGNLTSGIDFYRKLSEKEPAEVIFTMIGNTLRDLYWVSVDFSKCDYPMWRKNKLVTQARKFKLDKLSNLIKELAEIDMKVKRDGSKLSDELELFVIRVLK